MHELMLFEGEERGAHVFMVFCLYAAAGNTRTNVTVCVMVFCLYAAVGNTRPNVNVCVKVRGAHALTFMFV